MKLRIISITTLLLLFLSGCGFKVVNKSELSNFKIVEINTFGEKRINFNLKNKLSFARSSESNPLSLDLNTIKEKNIKEKNIQNEITKYEIIINTRVKFRAIKTGLSGEFAIKKTGDYTVANQYSQTLTNEKNLTKILTNNIVEEIINELIIRINAI